MKLKNYEMENMIFDLEPLLERRDIVGFAAAKNTRILREEATEYLDLKMSLVQEYGEPDFDDEGNFTGRYKIDTSSADMEKFAAEIETFANAEGEPDIYQISESEVIGKMSGNEILKLHWMISEGE